MNIEKLKLAEEQFLMRYPGGYHNPEIQVIIKKHKIEKLTVATREQFAPEEMEDVEKVVVLSGGLSLLLFGVDI